jgi:1-acyl-sn-glycerol-3-phosphate acyltransferase
MIDRIKDAAKSWADQYLGEELCRKVEALPNPRNEYGYDAFGFHRDDARIAMAAVHFLYRHYFRVEVFGMENVPDGPCLLVANHSGQLPFDGMGVVASLLFDRNPPRIARSMVEKFAQRMPFISYVMGRWGQILGTPENCRRLLAEGEVILVFPEGSKGISKPITQRYQLQEFGLGFMRLALENKVPIVPVAIIGAEEQAPAFNVRPVARLIGTPAFPVMPFPPFLPILPLPSKYRIYFGEARNFIGQPDDEDEDVAVLVKLVRNTIQSMIQVGLKERKHIFW